VIWQTQEGCNDFRKSLQYRKPVSNFAGARVPLTALPRLPDVHSPHLRPTISPSATTMKVAHSKNRAPAARDANLAKIVREASPGNLRVLVEMLAFPRHYKRESRANRRARDLLLKHARSMGYVASLQGPFDNVVITTHPSEDGPFVLLGAHYDSVPGAPGADDNASAVAVCLECARLIKKNNLGPAMIVLFNREEDGLLGSSEFVASLARHPSWNVKEAHIFEMVGYRDRTPGSQRLPPGLPIVGARDVGDFLALLANSSSNAIAEDLLRLAARYIPDTPVAALKVYLRLEKAFDHLNRSDHAPFWSAGIPSIMWTDTSEFRNPHYHLPSDTPDTLDYEFMSEVARLALARVVSAGRAPKRQAASGDGARRQS
jgi:Zn-dependent M28 family amino/carboxypeptidase